MIKLAVFNVSSIYFFLMTSAVFLQSLMSLKSFFNFAVLIETFWLTIFCLIQTYLTLSNNGVFTFLSAFVLLLATFELVFVMIQSVIKE